MSNPEWMGRYSREELRAMAQITLKAKEYGTPEYSVFISLLTHVTGYTEEECLEKIKELADEDN